MNYRRGGAFVVFWPGAIERSFGRFYIGWVLFRDYTYCVKVVTGIRSPIILFSSPGFGSFSLTRSPDKPKTHKRRSTPNP